MKVSLSPELERFVEEKVRAGQYQNADEVVNSAVDMLRQQETLSAEDIAELRREIAIGLEQLERGESAPNGRPPRHSCKQLHVGRVEA